jgi:hypothetical protein
MNFVIFSENHLIAMFRLYYNFAPYFRYVVNRRRQTRWQLVCCSRRKKRETKNGSGIKLKKA